MKAGDIVVLEGLEAIRKRPEMYLGDPRDPETKLCAVVEATCLAADALVAGTATRASVTLSPDAILVEDDGPGLPLTRDPRGVLHAEALFGALHACRLAKAADDVARDFCTFGIVVTNALSRFFEVDFIAGGSRWHQRYERGVAVAPMSATGPSNERGTRIRFRLDEALFGDTSVPAGDLRARLAVHDEVLRGRLVVRERA